MAVFIKDSGKGKTEMATRVVTLLEDDFDGTEASETVTFALDGVGYEIDLSENNATELREALRDYISRARQISGRTQPRRGRQDGQPKVDPKAVRAWAQANNIPISSRGRVAADVVRAYKEAGN